MLSFRRCYAIVYPMRAKSACTVRKAYKVIGIVWTMAFLLATPTLVVQIQLEVGLFEKALWCVRDFDRPGLWRTHELYSLFVLLLCPGSLMMLAYGAITREICRCMRERSLLVAGQPDAKHER